jgi:hypothetical protein
MNFVKKQMCNWIGDEQLNACLLAYTERDIFDNVELENEKFLHDFQNILQKGLVIL